MQPSDTPTLHYAIGTSTLGRVLVATRETASVHCCSATMRKRCARNSPAHFLARR